MLQRRNFELKDLVNTMLDALPAEIWTSSTTTFLDPSIGGGQFVSAIERRLADAGHSVENIKNRVFGFEANKLRIRTTIGRLKLKGTYTRSEFINEDINMKFDVVVGNPPYQNNHSKDETAKRKVGNKLWYQFIFKADEIVKENGYVAMVTPNQWLSGGVQMRKGNLGVLKDLFAKKQLITATVSGVTEKYFRNIGISIGWWMYKNTENTEATTFDLGGTTLNIDLKGRLFLSPEATEESLNIVAKTLLAANDKFNTYYFNSQCKPGLHNETEEATADNVYPHWIMGSTVTDNMVVRYFPKQLNKKVGYKKVLFPMSTRYWQPALVDSDVNVASLGQALEVDENTTQEGFESVFYSKLFKYLNFNLQIAQNGFMKTAFVKALPKLDMSITWTDADLYKHFKLTQDEINYIEEKV